MCAPMSVTRSAWAPVSVPSRFAAILISIWAGKLLWSCMSSSRVSVSFTGRRAFRARATQMGTGVFIWMLDPNVPPTGTLTTLTLLNGMPKSCPRTMRTLWIDWAVGQTVIPPSPSGRQTTDFVSICE